MNVAGTLRTFSGKRVFVTGHTGFKGSWLTFLLTEIGAEVLGYALPPAEGPSHFESLKLQNRIRHVVGDVRDAVCLSNTMQSFKPEYVFHLAARALVKKCYDNPVDTFATNVLGSVHLLEAVRQCDAVQSLVYITSDKCYENVEWVWGYRETDRLGGRDPYSASKAAAEIVFSAYSRSYFVSRPHLGAATARAGNVIGGGDWAADRIVPDCIRAAKSGSVVQLRNPKATRPWQHVLEPLSGYLLLAERLRADPRRFAGSWNFGPASSEVRTVEEVANSISSAVGARGVEVPAVKEGRHEAQLLQLNCDKAHQLLGWHPRWSIDRTLTATAEWYKGVMDGHSAESMTRAHIYEYFPELS